MSTALPRARVPATESTVVYRVLLCLALLMAPPGLLAQQRWFQVEVSIFSNESSRDRAAEIWAPGRIALDYPPGLQRLQRLPELLHVPALEPQSPSAVSDRSPAHIGQEAGGNRTAPPAEPQAPVGPLPLQPATDFRFIDFARDAFLQLPDRQSDFQQTNRALQRSPEHRLLFHGLWRQPVENTGAALPLYVSGGERYGEHQELQGSLIIRFNDNRDRVVIDVDLWLTEFSILPPDDSGWHLPATPAGFHAAFVPDEGNRSFFPVRVYPMQQSRAMRSTEFHYLDHPALGVVVRVEPYTLPAAEGSGFHQSADNGKNSGV